MNYIRPSFFIIGERKCGTSSLYRYLVQHPNILPCALKEPNFFGKGESYVPANIAKYWSLFPPVHSEEDRTFIWPELNEAGILYEEEVSVQRVKNRHYITGEASANTFYEVAPSLVKTYLPNVKLIILLRHPVDRAFSHHRMYQRFQEEGRKLAFTVHSFEEDVVAEMTAIKAGKSGQYLSPSIYLPSLKKWVDVFGKAAIRIYFTEDLRLPKQAAIVLADLQNFLELPLYDYGDFLEKHFNRAPSAQFSTELRQRLGQFFQPYNQALFDYLNLPNRW